MKKTLLFIVIALSLLGYLLYQWMLTNEWTFF